jgi:glycosyltransferase involved in cell wall biosynthesis
MRISILNAGQQTDYLYGLVSGLSQIQSLEIEVVDSDNSINLFNEFSRVSFFNLRGDNLSRQLLPVKIWRISRYYIRLLWYTARTKSRIFHIEWENSIALFDRTLLILYYRMCGKKLIFTAHNVYKEARDERATFLRRISLKVMYNLMDSIVVHTPKMKEELCSLFHVSPEKVIVIPHGINNRVLRKDVAQEESRRKLGIKPTAHVILFFGQIDEYKGVETLVDAVALLVKEDPLVVLLIAGKPKHLSEYISKIQMQAAKNLPEKNVILRFQFIPIDEVETYFAAADCLVLPYIRIYQSGIIFLAYRFGLPIIATDVGSFREDVIDGVTGFICKPDNVEDMAAKLKIFFDSPLFHQQKQTRAHIIKFAEQKYSWTSIGRQTYEVYANLTKHS